MANKKTVEKINYDSTYSVMQRMAASAINENRKPNGHINQDYAAMSLAKTMNIPREEAQEYVKNVISTANDMEWKG